MKNHQSAGHTSQQIEAPDLLQITIRPCPQGVGHPNGVRGFVNDPGYRDYHDTMILFPKDGVEMKLLPHQVAFVAVTDVTIRPGKGPHGKQHLFGTPVGQRSFADPAKGRQEATGILIDDMERFLERKATTSSADKAFESVQRNGEIPFVQSNNKHYPLSAFDAAAGAANHEVIMTFMELVARVENPTAPSGVIIGGRLMLANRHDAILCTAHPELAATAAAYLISLGWWVVSAYPSPSGEKWAFLMTSSPQAAWDYTPRQQATSAPKPQRQAAPAKPHVPAVARAKPATVAQSFDALTVVLPTQEAVVAPAPAMEMSHALVVVPTAMSSPTPQLITDEQMEQAMDFVGQADSDEADLLLAGLCFMAVNGGSVLSIIIGAPPITIPMLHPSTIAVIEQKLRPEAPTDLTDPQRQSMMTTTVPMFCNAESGWIAAVVNELATLHEIPA